MGFLRIPKNGQKWPNLSIFSNGKNGPKKPSKIEGKYTLLLKNQSKIS